MNRKSPSEIAKIAYSIEAENWIKDSTSIKELDDFIHLIPAQMLIEKVYTYQLAIDKKAQLQFESNQDASRRREEREEETSRIARRAYIIAIIAAIIAALSIIKDIIIDILINKTP
ncbi:MAG: hypothetical protein AB1401_03555 [Thermodesulfobacteriota bacterium]